MRHHHRLRALLPALAGAAIAACDGTVVLPSEGSSGTSGTSGGSSGSSGSSGTGTSGGTSGTGSSGFVSTLDLDVCTGSQYRALEGVTRADGNPGPDGSVEYMELREEYEPTGGGEPSILAKAGTPCASATDGPKCQQDLSALRSAAGWKPINFGNAPPAHRYVVWTVGDAIQSITELDALRLFVLPTESVKDAALLATASGQYRFTCDGTKNATKTSAGWDVRVQSGQDCGAGSKIEEHILEVTTAGVITVKQTTLLKEGDPNCAIGRRPEGLVARTAEGGADVCDGIGRFFAEAAHLEAASVVAFERLAEELGSLGAPRELVESALESRDDEIRHARMTAKVAERFGARPYAPEVAPASSRSALEIALENAVEGCVRETYGALVAHHQAAAAADRSIARVMHSIADDETRHAGLAWDVAAWLEPQLSPEARDEVIAARAQAIDALREALASEPSRALREIAGMPSAATAISMLDALNESFLQPAA
jgi:hypothetical protein